MSPIALDAVVERRLLVNFAVEPEVAASLLPDGLRPRIVSGSAVAGICLIRMGGVRPSGLPVGPAWRGEAAAHRIAVDWDASDGPRTGVWIPVRQSASVLPVLAGGRLGPGVHRRARFTVAEADGRYRVAVDGPEERLSVDVRSDPAGWRSALFPSVDDASEFFRAGSIGWSPGRRGDLEGLVLETDRWAVTGATADRVSSSFFERLPVGSAVLDSVLLMRDVPVRWRRPGRAALPRPSAERLPATA